MIIANYDVKRVLVDSGSSIDVLFYDILSRMKLSKNQLGRISTPLVSFSGDLIEVKGEITLPVVVGSPPGQTIVHLTFTVVWVPSVYNVILKHPRFN